MFKPLSLIGVACILACPSAMAAPDATTIAVMPFANITKDPQVEWLGAGFAETIATKLCMVSGIQYVERSQLAQALKELKLQDTALADPTTAGKLGKVLGARQVIIGSFQKFGDKLKVDARVVEVETSTATRSADVTGSMEGVFDLQSDLARKLIGAMGKTATDAESEAVAVAPTKSLTAYEWYSKALKLQDEGKSDDAIEAYTRAIELDPAYVYAYNNRGNRYTDKGELDKAIADFDKALRIDPNDEVVYNNRGMVYADKREYDKAIADYTQAIRIKPDYAKAYGSRGTAYSSKGQPDNAIADFNTALSLDPANPISYNNRGLVYADKREYDKAIADYDKAIQIKPDYAKAYNNRGSAYAKKHDYDKAIADYDSALRIKPDYDLPCYNKGLTFEDLNKPEEAIAAFRQFIRLASPRDTDRINKANQHIAALEKP